MTLLTLGKYLIGDRGAILQIAASRQALWLGLLFVLAAGFAREYDGEDLLHEPWHVLLPLAASLGSSAVLYLLVRLVAWFRGAREPGLVNGYLDFLGLYWLTAPLALVYAIPVERFLLAEGAMRANLWLLALVALWRVLLMARVVSVLYGTGFVAASWVVMLFGDTVALVVSILTPVQLLVEMSGIRLSGAEALLAQTKLVVMVLGFYSWPVWLIGAVVVCFPVGQRWQYQATDQPPHVARHVWAAAGVSLAIWILILPFTQPEQLLRSRIERYLRDGRIREALELMSAHERSDFPPNWDPPPRLGYREFVPDPTDVQECLTQMEVRPWVREIFAAKFGNSLRRGPFHSGVWSMLTTEEIERRITLIERLPERAELVRDQQNGLSHLLGDERIADQLQDRIDKLLKEAGVLSSDGTSGLTPPP